MADGEIVFRANLDDSRLNKKLQRVRDNISRLKTEMQTSQTGQSGIEKQLQDIDKQTEASKAKIKSLAEELQEAEKSGSGAVLRKDANSKSGWTTVMAGQIREEMVAQINAQQELAQQKQGLQSALGQEKAKEQAITQELQKQEGIAGKLQAKSMEKSTKGLKGLGEAVGGASMKFKKGFLTVLKYGFGIRSLFFLFRKLRAGVQEGMNALMGVDSGLRDSMIKLKSSLAELKGSWASAFSPIIQSVTPMLQSLIGWLNRCANAIASFFATLSGKGTYKKAVANTGKIANDLAGGAGSAKEINKQLAGFDELEILQDNSDSGGGGGGSGKDIGFVDAEVEPDTAFTEWLKEIIQLTKDWWALLDFEPLKTAWESLKESFNNLMQPIFQLLTFLWTEICLPFFGWIIEQLAPAILDLFASINDALTAFLQPVVDGLTFIWEALKPVFDFIGSVVIMILQKLKELFDKVAQVFVEKGDKIREILEIVGEAISLLWTFAQPILDLVKQYVGDVFSSVGDIIATVVGTAIDVLHGLLTFIHGVFTGDWQQAWDGIKEIFSSIWSVIEGIGRGVINSIIGAVETFVNTIIAGLNSVLSALSTAVSWIGGSGGSIQIGYVHFARLAKGGIVDDATMFMAGEAGKEAVIPLERNTEWIGLVADGLIEKMTNATVLNKFADAFMSVPALAYGGIVPPNANAEISLSGIATALDRIQASLGAEGDSNNTFKFFLDGKEIYARVEQLGKQATRARGA